MDTDSNDDRGVFTYIRLPDAARFIRLIEVKAASDRSQTLTVFVSIVPVREARNYHAVSYTWGDPAQEEEIRIEYRDITHGDHSDQLHAQSGKATVRKNCANVLRQLCFLNTAKYYWIDAICIDQRDLGEKNHQVAMMGQTFARADSVLACIGMHYGDSNFMVGVLRQFEEHLADAGLSSVSLTAGARRWTKDSALVDACYSWVLKTSQRKFERFFRALDTLAQRAYFWRLWILQELYLARHVRVFCAYDELSLSSLLFWWREVRDFLLHGHAQVSDDSLPSLIREKLGFDYLAEAEWWTTDSRYFAECGGSGLGSTFEAMLYTHQFPDLSKDRPSRQLMALHDLLRLLKDRECQDIRDTIYGTLSLTDWTKRQKLELAPDYSKTPYQLVLYMAPRLSYLVEFEQLSKLLGVDLDSVEMKAAVAKRKLSDVEDTGESSRHPRGKSSRLIYSATIHGVIQVTRHTLVASSFTRIQSTGNWQAIASSGVRQGDKIFHTLGCRYLILRQQGKRYVVVGKAWSASALPQPYLTALSTEVQMWFDVEDLLVHLLLDGRVQDTEDTGLPSKDLIKALSVRVCTQPNSSYGKCPSLEQQTEQSRDADANQLQERPGRDVSPARSLSNRIKKVRVWSMEKLKTSVSSAESP